jgi:hypothetical protein
MTETACRLSLPLGATDWTIADPLAWQDVELDVPVTVEGSFFVGIRQVTAQRVDIGMDFCAAQQTSTFFAVTQDTGPWDDIADFGFPQVLCIRAFATGSFAASEIELNPTPVRQTISMRSEGNNDISANFFNAPAQAEETGKSAAVKGGLSKDEISLKATQHVRTVFEPRAPRAGFNAETACRDELRSGRPQRAQSAGRRDELSHLPRQYSNRAG